jgi:hypothetical protein
VLFELVALECDVLLGSPVRKAVAQRRRGFDLGAGLAYVHFVASIAVRWPIDRVVVIWKRNERRSMA